MEMSSFRRTRAPITTVLNDGRYNNISASYTHISSLKDVISKETERVVIQHGLIENLEGLEKADKLKIVFLAFNKIQRFRPKDQLIKHIEVLYLNGNRLESLENHPPCTELNVSATCIENLKGLREGVKIIRVGHSEYIKSLDGCPASLELIECSQAKNLVIDRSILPNDIEIVQ